MDFKILLIGVCVLTDWQCLCQADLCSFSNRTAILKLNRSNFSNTINLFTGRPLGSVLSPTLFILLLHDFPLLLNPTLKLALFTDEITFWACADTIKIFANHNKLIISLKVKLLKSHYPYETRMDHSLLLSITY